MKTNKSIDKRVEEIASEAHNKWLSKAETAVIIGNEMTVLPYGYLQQAVKEALTKHHQDLIDEVVKMKKKHEPFDEELAGYNQAIDDIIKNLTRE